MTDRHNYHIREPIESLQTEMKMFVKEEFVNGLTKTAKQHQTAETPKPKTAIFFKFIH